MFVSFRLLVISFICKVFSSFRLYRKIFKLWFLRYKRKVIHRHLCKALAKKVIKFRFRVQFNLDAVHTTPEEFENGGFTLKTHQMFSFHTKPEELNNEG